jgi:hypothetical protein
VPPTLLVEVRDARALRSVHSLLSQIHSPAARVGATILEVLTKIVLPLIFTLQTTGAISYLSYE